MKILKRINVSERLDIDLISREVPARPNQKFEFRHIRTIYDINKSEN